MAESTLEQIQADTKDAMRAGDKPRVGALRLIADALQKDQKSGGEDEVAVLRRERKRRIEAAEAYRSGGDAERAQAEEAEAELISAYLPAELSNEELAGIVDEAIAATGAAGPKDTGKVMGAAMGRVAGRADGKRVSALVRERLQES
ncbi:MAG: GatB/YqeY domain-containing protein [Actinomycetota bacterium]|nr:GatB/YqeY domain-containing protein [Actinomycetota bacterium]